MTIWLVELEAVETRYTGQWKTHLPNLLETKTGQKPNIVSGPTDIPEATTPGAFLNFGGTNIFKSAQLETLSRAFTGGDVKDGDTILITDAWNPGVLQLRYMADLLGIKVRLAGIWHAGSYDPADFLGRLIENKNWSYNAERAFFHAYDINFLATQFHIDLFKRELEIDGFDNKIVLTGFPFEYLPETLAPFSSEQKRDLILFPHRIAPEKQPDIFRDLATALPEYEWVICQDQQLSKGEYHKLLGEAKIVFSANQQETLGISVYEGALVGAIPMVPDRLSYQEIWIDELRYPSEWTIDWENYKQHRNELVEKAQSVMNSYETSTELLDKALSNADKFYKCDNFLNALSA